MELLRSRSEPAGTQVVATTHSPTTLEWLNESEYPTTFLAGETSSQANHLLADVRHFKEM